jgi:hypothetical protein
LHRQINAPDRFVKVVRNVGMMGAQAAVIADTFAPLGIQALPFGDELRFQSVQVFRQLFVEWELHCASCELGPGAENREGGASVSHPLPRHGVGSPTLFETIGLAMPY